MFLACQQVFQKLFRSISFDIKQGYKDSNLEMTESESVALPFGDSPRERVMGIEPTYPAWKAGVLPLNYTRV